MMKGELKRIFNSSSSSTSSSTTNNMIRASIQMIFSAHSLVVHSQEDVVNSTNLSSINIRASLIPVDLHNNKKVTKAKYFSTSSALYY